MKPLNIKAALAAFGIGAGAMAIAYIFPVGLMLMPALLAFAGTVWGRRDRRRRHNMHSGNCGLEHNRRAGDVHTRGHSDDLYLHK